MLDNKFWDKVTISKTNFYEETPCWEWTAYIQPNGYGGFWYNGKKELAHRVSYEEKYGTIPKGLVINHLCRNRACQNRDDHLEVITRGENIRKGLAGFVGGLRMRTKTHCPQGHEYSKENTYITSVGGRDCRSCGRIQSQQYQHKKRNQN